MLSYIPAGQRAPSSFKLRVTARRVGDRPGNLGTVPVPYATALYDITTPPPIRRSTHLTTLAGADRAPGLGCDVSMYQCDVRTQSAGDRCGYEEGRKMGTYTMNTIKLRVLKLQAWARDVGMG